MSILIFSINKAGSTRIVLFAHWIRIRLDKELILIMASLHFTRSLPRTFPFLLIIEGFIHKIKIQLTISQQEEGRAGPALASG
jgi:hypothetical protein